MALAAPRARRAGRVECGAAAAAAGAIIIGGGVATGGCANYNRSCGRNRCNDRRGRSIHQRDRNRGAQRRCSQSPRPNEAAAVPAQRSRERAPSRCNSARGPARAPSSFRRPRRLRDRVRVRPSLLPSRTFNRNRASRTRPRNVAAGMLSAAAISSCVRSPAAVSSSASRSFGGSRRICLLHRPDELRRLHARFGRRCHIPQCVQLCFRRQRPIHFPPYPPAPAQRQTPRDRDHPRPDARITTKLIDAHIGQHQRFLRDIFGVGVVTERRERSPVDGAAMAFDQLAEGGSITGAHLLDKLAVGHPSTLLRMTLSISIEMSKGHALYRRLARSIVG